MKVLLFGGNSSVACALKPKLLEFCQVVTAGRQGCDMVMDLADAAENIVIPNDVDVVINTAAHFGGKSAAEILAAENINVLGTLKLCQAAVASNVKHFILVSSMFADLDADAENYSVYALSKKHGDELATYYCSMHNLPLTILKPSQIYGIGDSFRKHQPFFYSILDKAQNNEDVNLYGTNDPIRNYIFIDDITSIIAEVLKQKVTGVYTCAQTKDVTYSEIAHAAFKVFNATGKVNFIQDKPNIPNFVFTKNDALFKLIGFYPQVTLEEGIKRIATNTNTQ